MKILDVGAGEDSNARRYWPDGDVHTLDADPAIPATLHGDMLSIPCPDGEYDKVLASHVLEHIDYRDAIGACKEMARVLAPGGELHILVPSLEWAARQILSEKPSPVTIMHIYGLESTPWQYHKGGFTMMALRGVVEQAGMRVAAARRSVYHVTGTNGNGEPVKFPAEQHYVVGVKNANHASGPKV